MKKTAFTLLWVCFGALFCSCSEKEGSEAQLRKEFIKVYETTPDKLVDAIQVPLQGVKDGQIHVLTNVDIEWKFFMSQESTETAWIDIKSFKEIEKGHFLLTYDAESLLDKNSLELRGGRLSFYCPEQSLGKFMIVDQGHELIFSEPFTNEQDGNVKLTGKLSHTTKEYPVLNSDFYDYISFNAWAESTTENLSKNITLDVTISGGKFYDTQLTTFRVNVPLGTGADKSNLKYLLIQGNGERFSSKTNFTFSTDNDDNVYVYVDNFAAYKVTEAEMFNIFGDEDYMDEEESDWI